MMASSNIVLPLSLGNCPPDQYSVPFLQGMLNRVTVGFYKYGPAKDQVNIDWIRSLELRIEEYKRTGNGEFLIDAANYAMLEFLYPKLPHSHFRPTDSEESPGRVTLEGGVSHEGTATEHTFHRHEGD